MSGPMLEREIQHAIRLALGSDRRCVVFRNTTGFYKENGRAISYGVGGPGGADLLGILRPSGKWFALEVKQANGRVTDEQALFLRLVREAGGFAAVVRSVGEAMAALDRALAGASE